LTKYIIAFAARTNNQQILFCPQEKVSGPKPHNDMSMIYSVMPKKLGFKRMDPIDSRPMPWVLNFDSLVAE